MTRTSVRSTAAVSSPGRIRQFTVAFAIAGNAFSAWPACSIVATQVVRSSALYTGTLLSVANAAAELLDHRLENRLTELLEVVLGAQGFRENDCGNEGEACDESFHPGFTPAMMATSTAALSSAPSN